MAQQESDPNGTLRRPGWVKYPGEKWQTCPPDPPTPVDMAGVDESLEASHKRITRVLAVHSRRLELTADAGLSRDDVASLGELAKVWRTLEANIEKLAEKAIEKAIKRELARLGKDERDGLGSETTGTEAGD